MIWDLPTFVKINEKKYNITNKCDYRVVLDVFCALNDEDLNNKEKIACALVIFYEDINLENIGKCKDVKELAEQMLYIISGGESPQKNDIPKPRLMDWEHDFPRIAPAVSRVVGYDVRTSDRYCHFWTFLGAYMEIGECAFSSIISIRSKKQKNKKPEKWEQEFYNDNKKIIDLPQKLTAEEQDFLNSDW